MKFMPVLYVAHNKEAYRVEETLLHCFEKREYPPIPGIVLEPKVKLD
jgi:hypothetical protein